MYFVVKCRMLDINKTCSLNKICMTNKFQSFHYSSEYFENPTELIKVDSFVSISEPGRGRTIGKVIEYKKTKSWFGTFPSKNVNIFYKTTELTCDDGKRLYLKESRYDEVRRDFEYGKAIDFTEVTKHIIKMKRIAKCLRIISILIGLSIGICYFF